MDTPKTNWLSPFWLNQGLLITAAVLAWNATSLGYTVYIHKYMQRWDWWWVLALLVFLFLLSLVGLLIALRNAKLNKITLRHTQKKHWLLPLQTGLITFLTGWIPCAFIMMRINALEPWCYIGILGAILGDWLPIGVGASVIVGIGSWNMTKKMVAPEDSVDFE